MKKIKDTKSICPICLKIIPAATFRNKNKIYIKKTCPKHGNFKAPHVWDDPEIYKTLVNLKKFEDYPARKLLLNITNDCNLNCNFCYAKSNQVKIKNLFLEDIKKINLNGFDYIFLSGGEPTINKDFFKIVDYLKWKKKKIILLTNGIKLVEESFIKKIKNIDLVYLQFDSLREEDYKYIRGIPLLKIKIKIVNNLSKYNIPTYLFSIMLDKNNKKTIEELINMFIEKKNILKGINLNTIWKIGRYNEQNWMPTSKIIKNLVEVLKIKKEDIIESTIFNYYLFILISSLTNKRRYFPRCMLFLLVIFDNKKIIPITKILDVKRLNYLLRKSCEKKRFIPFLILDTIFYQILFGLLKNKNLRLFFSQTLNKIKFLKRNNLFLINPFTTINISEFASEEDIDLDFLTTCNLYSIYEGKIGSTCLNQIKFAKKNERKFPLYQ